MSWLVRAPRFAIRRYSEGPRILIARQEGIAPRLVWPGLTTTFAISRGVAKEHQDALAREVRLEDEAALDAVDAEVEAAEVALRKAQRDRQAVYEMIAHRSPKARVPENKP